MDAAASTVSIFLREETINHRLISLAEISLVVVRDVPQEVMSSEVSCTQRAPPNLSLGSDWLLDTDSVH